MPCRAGWCGARRGRQLRPSVHIASLIAALALTTLATAALADDAPAIFKERCAACHEHPTGRTPAREYLLSRLPSEMTYALTRGIMKQKAEGLTPEQIAGLASYLTGGKPVDRLPDDDANLCGAKAGPAAPKVDGWSTWGGNPANSRYQPNPGFTAADLPRLKVKWSFALPGLAGEPIVDANRLFVASRLGRVFALNATTGCTYWSYETGAPVRSAVAVGLAGTTVAAFFGDQNADIRAVDAATGKLIWQVKADPYANAQIVGSPTYYEGRLYVPVTSDDEADAFDPAYPCCKFRGEVVAMDAADGRIVWRGYTIAEEPKPTKVNSAGTQMFGPSGGGVWTAPTIDPKRKLVYAVSGNAYSPPVADGTDATVAFDMATGRRVWANQAIAGDVWLYRCEDKSGGNCPDKMGGDLDFTSPPMLLTQPNGHQTLVAGSKGGTVWAYDPDNQGKLLWVSRVAKGGMGSAMWGLASDGQSVYAAVPGAAAKDGDAPGGLTALDLSAGKIAWHVPGPTSACGWGEVACLHHSPSAVTVIPGAVFSGSVDGHMRAFSVTDGALLWDMDTARTYDAVNGVKAFGGNIDGAAQTVANGTLFVNSGNSTATSPHRGDAVLAITIDGK